MKKPSAIFLARSGQGYAIKTPGWQRRVPAREIRGVLALAWMQYGHNPSGCEVVGSTEGLETYIAELKSGKAAGRIMMRVGHAEKAGIEAQARKDGYDSITAYLLALHHRYTGNTE